MEQIRVADHLVPIERFEQRSIRAAGNGGRLSQRKLGRQQQIPAQLRLDENDAVNPTRTASPADNSRPATADHRSVKAR
ncbi:MAG: hypothetical protein HRT86_09115 [Ilumatobacteraceae bacterium]|nr:hypothetical protein [Ilumatobacteraceae bacterium]